MPTERIAILVDGSNLYHYLRELKLTELAEFDYKAFAQHLARGGRTLVSATYYIGKVRSHGDVKGEELRRWQQRLVAHLQNSGWNVEYGHMLEHNGVFQEKGVDVHIAVRGKKKQVEYIGFAHRPSFGLMKNVDLTTTLRREDLAGFLKKP